jgi:mannosyltransferase
MHSRLFRGRDRLLTMVALLAIFALGMALRLYQLDEDSLWYDEIWTANCARLDLASMVALVAEDIHPPLAYVVTHFLIALFGENEFILRLQAVLFGSLSVVLAYKVGEILWSRATGLMGAFLLAISAYHVQYSQEARQYALMVLLCLLSLIFLAEALRKGQKRLWAGFSLCATLSIYNHYSAFLFLVAMVPFAAWTIGEQWVSRTGNVLPGHDIRRRGSLSAPAWQVVMLFLSLALVGLLYLPWLPTLLTGITRRVISEPLAISPRGLRSSLVFLAQVTSAYSGSKNPALLVWLGLSLLGLATSGRRQAALALLWMGMPFVFVSMLPPERYIHPRYFLFVLPLYVVVTAHGATAACRFVSRTLERVRRDPRWLFASVSASAILFGSLGVSPLSNYYAWQKEDWRGAAEYLSENVAPGDIVLADSRFVRAGHPFWVGFSLSYYLDWNGMDNLPVLAVQRGLWAQLRDLGQHRGEVWIVLAYPDRPTSWETLNELVVVDFQDVPIIRMRDASGNVLQDTTSALNILLRLLRRPEARFDIDLALAEIHEHTGSCDQASLHLQRALESKPGDAEASEDLGEAVAEWEEACPGLPVP